MRVRPKAASLLLCATIALSSACEAPRQSEAPQTDSATAQANRSPNPPPIILISIDTLRSDHLPAYGYAGVDTPAIDALAGDGIVYERAYAHTPLTLPSHVSILTGLLPSSHGVRDNQGFDFDSSVTSFLPRELKRLGYATGAAVSAYVLRGESGLAADFDVYEDAIELREGTALGGVARPGEATLRAIEPWLRSVAGGPFFLFFHLFEPHLPHAPPPGRRARYASPYDGEIAAADAVVGRLLDLLRRLGAYDGAVIVLLSDHGEGLGDHGEQEHGILLYREALQVPLVIKLAGGARAGSRVAAPAQLVDVYPTILDAAGIELPGELAEGRNPGTSLLALAEDEAPRRIYAETFYPRLHYGWSELTSVIDGDSHFIDGPDPELYDLVGDPEETRNVVDLDRRTATELRRHLASFDRTLKAPAAVDPETRQKLAALGYLGGTAPAPDGPLPDPKTRLPTLGDLRRATEHVARGELAAAVPLYRKALAANPRMLDGWLTLGDVLRRQGNLEQAVGAYAKAFELSGGDRELAVLLAHGYQQLSRHHRQRSAGEPARVAARHALDLDPDRPEAWNQLGVARYQLGDKAAALDAWQRAVEIDPRNLDTLYNLGTRAAELGRREQARQALESFVEQAPPERAAGELRRARVLLRRLER